MNDEVFDQQDQEVIAMTNDRNGRVAAKKVVFIPQPELQNLEQMYQCVQGKQENRAQLKKVGATLFKVGAGLIFIGGMARGLVDPGFALMAALCCAAWAMAGWRK